MSGGRFVLSDADREALKAWWDSDWPVDGALGVLDVLATTVEVITQRAVNAALNDAAAQLQQKASELMDAVGPSSERGAAIWDSAAWLAEDYLPSIRARTT